MNENTNGIICTIDNINKCVRIDQVANYGNEQCEMITMMIVRFSNGNMHRESAPLFLDEPLPLDVSKDRLKQAVSKLVIAHYGNEYPWINVDSFDVMPDADVWHIGRRLSCLVLMFFASLAAFALTETVDGIEWSYYVKNGYAVLEHPDTRKHSSKPKPAHQGVLPQSLELPSVLGGVPVREIGIAAIQIDTSLDVKTLVVPESVIAVSSAAFLGPYTKTETSYGIYYYTEYCYGPIAVDNILFKGNRPDLWASCSWRLNSDYDYRCLIRGSTSLRAWCVEGCDGWSENKRYSYSAGGIDVLYGAAKVDMSPIDGVCQAGVISLSCTNSFAVLRYTIDGSEPVTNDVSNCFVYGAPIPITHKMTVKAMACVEVYPYTVTYTKEFAFGKVQIPNISASQHVFNWSGNMITLSCETEDAEIHYTLDGSEPTEESALYMGPFAIDDTTTVKAKAYKTDWFESETATATFTREWYTVETPDITPGDTIFANASQEVSISCGTEDAIILYTTDGSDPATNGREYKRPFKVYNTCTVRAVAVKYDWKNSEEATATMTRGEPLSAAANLYGYKMGTDAEKPWVVDTTVSHDGVSSIRSNGDGSYVQTSVNGRGTLSFWWRAMCEEPGYEWYDHGAFVMGGDTVTRIAGEDTGWVYYSMTFSTLGKHVLRWEYHKDEEGDFYPDCVWLDQVQWVPEDGSGYTLTSPEPVPYSWLSQYGLGAASGDFEAAANAASGKMSLGRPTTVWEEFVAGLDPTNENSRFEAKIEMVDGAPVVKWEPDLNTNGIVRIYKVYGRESLAEGEWQYPTNSLHRFFRVDVDMP